MVGSVPCGVLLGASSLKFRFLPMFKTASSWSPSASVMVAVSVIRSSEARVVDWSGPLLGVCMTERD